jgi:Bax protein
MRPLLTSLAAGLLLAVAADSIHADQGQEPFVEPPGEGVRWARSAVSPFKSVAYTMRQTAGRAYLVRASTGRSHTELPDFENYRDVQARKQRFFGYLLPLVKEENQRLADIRQRLNYIHEHVRWHEAINMEDRVWLEGVVEEFRIPEEDVQSPAFWETALRRVDTLPEMLVLVQAANESAWGTSRFAREGNNLFGQWCFRQGCGLVPQDRPAGATYEVARFDSVSESIGSYMHNLNTGYTYRELREIRAAMRANGRQPGADELARGLSSYSERGQEYIDELRSMIRHNAEVIEAVRNSEPSESRS